MKRNDDAKSKGCARGSYQRVWAEKSEVPSMTPGVYSLNHVRSTEDKDFRDTSSAGLPRLSLQEESNKEEKVQRIKLDRAVNLLLVECDKNKQWNHLLKKGGK